MTAQTISKIFSVGQIVLATIVALCAYIEVGYHTYAGNISGIGWIPTIAITVLVTKMWQWSYRELKEDFSQSSK